MLARLRRSLRRSRPLPTAAPCARHAPLNLTPGRQVRVIAHHPYGTPLNIGDLVTVLALDDLGPGPYRGECVIVTRDGFDRFIVRRWCLEDAR